MANEPSQPREAVSVSADGKKQFPCARCGAKLNFEPGTDHLACPYCGFNNEIPKTDQVVEELDYRSQLHELEQGTDLHETMTVKCDACAAEVTAPPNVTAFVCPYCGNNIVATAKSSKQIKPGAILPFHIKRDQAINAFRSWIKSRWFAPSKLKREAGIDQTLSGVYMPAWTYDCDTNTRYTGARGDYYYTTETYTTTNNGRTETHTRQVRHTRWTPASGRVENSFDDVLVPASQSLPREMVEKLEPWDLKNVTPYRDEYLSGFRAESYQVDLPQGFDVAKGIMAPTIESTVRSDIGGDEQRVDQMDVRYTDITFKHLLLPVWVSAYRYKAKVYRFLVNARTGEVQGDRPYSWVKITLAVVAGVVAVVVIVVVAKGR